MTTRTLRDIGLIFLATILLTLLIWLPHILKINFYGLDFSNGFATIYRNYDGLEYIVIAKSFYNPSLIAAIPFSQPVTYYASHFPGYSFLILLFSPFLGFLKSMLFVSVLSTALSAVTFYFLVRDFKLTLKPLWLSLIFLILPARWLIVHSVGSAEPLFILLTLLAIYGFMKYEQNKKYLWIFSAGVLGLAAQLTRPPGILLFLALVSYLWFKGFKEFRNNGLTLTIKNHLKFFPLILIPLSLLFVFYLYSQSYGDFWAYFHSGDNIHLTFPPFQVFNKSQFWVGEIWLEDIVYIFILGFLAAFMLWKQKLHSMAFYVFTYLIASIFVAHRDISRYVLPIFPFCLIAFEKVLTSKEFKIVLIIVALAIYLYSQNFILNNTAPIPNLETFN
jgi:hypothetical protein